MAPATAGATVCGRVAAMFTLAGARSDSWAVSSAPTAPVSGRHALYFVFHGVAATAEFAEFAFDRMPSD